MGVVFGKTAIWVFAFHVAGWTSCIADEGMPSKTSWAYVNVGLIGVFYDESSTVYLSNEPVPRLALGIDNDVTLGLEIGYRFHENFAASVTVGIPPEVSVRGNDALPVKVGGITYGPLVVSTHYHFTSFGPSFEPYIGGGVAYMMIFDEQDGALSDLDVDNAFGPVLQFGVESRLNEHWALFADFKKIWLETEATGKIGNLPARADVSIDPFVTMIGFGYRLTETDNWHRCFSGSEPAAHGPHPMRNCPARVGKSQIEKPLIEFSQKFKRRGFEKLEYLALGRSRVVCL